MVSRVLSLEQTLALPLLHKLVGTRARRLDDSEVQELAEVYDANKKNVDFSAGLARLQRATCHARLMNTGILSVYSKDDVPKRLHEIKEFFRHSINDTFPDHRTISYRMELMKSFSESVKLEGLTKDDLIELLPEEINGLTLDNNSIRLFCHFLFYYFDHVNSHYIKELPIEGLLSARENVQSFLTTTQAEDNEKALQRMPQIEKFAIKVLGLENS